MDRSHQMQNTHQGTLSVPWESQGAANCQQEPLQFQAQFSHEMKAHHKVGKSAAGLGAFP